MNQPNSPQSQSSDRLVGQVLADRYQILSVLGEGGMGRVYLAEHVRMGRKSAVKVMSPNMALSADAISRFNREAANASRINHPNVAQIYDFGETTDGMLYLAMEFVEGETLRSLIQRGGPLPLARAADLTKQIADGLAAAHHLGIVHRDLKPDNILITKHHDGADWVKVVDFGIAKTVQGSGGENAGSQTVTTAGVSLGTPEYMSPEQLAGERLDPRTDLYSLGLVLFNMLTADMPYPKVTSKETLVRRLISKPHTLAEVAPWGNWPLALQAALDRALAPEPIDRYQSVSDFGRDVMAAVSGGPVSAATTAPVPAGRPTPGPTQRIDTEPRRSRVRVVDEPGRKRSLAAAGALLVMLALGAGAYAAMQARTPKATPAKRTASSSRVSPAPAPTAPTPPAATTQGSAAAPDSNGAKVSTAADSSRTASLAPETTKSAPPVSAKALAAQSPAPPKAAVAPPPDSADVVPPVPPGDTTRAGRDRQMSRLRHPMLRASGDTAATAALPTNDADRIRVLGEDIQGHLTRARQFVAQGDLSKARAEYREMGSVVVVLRQLYPGVPAETRIEQQMRLSINESIAACRTAIQDSTVRAKVPPNFRCEQLLPLGARGQRGRGALPPAWNR